MLFTARWLNGSFWVSPSEAYRTKTQGMSLTELAQFIGIPGSTIKPLHMAAWNGHLFESVTTKLRNRQPYIDYTTNDPNSVSEHNMIFYFPVDPHLNISDINGAAFAYPNEDNSGWLFLPCDEDWMLDHEEKLVAALGEAFAPLHRRLGRDFDFSAIAVFRNNTNLNIRVADSAYLVSDIADQFHADVETALRAWVRSKHIGWFHHNPHEAHIHAPIEQAIRATIAAWTADTAVKGPKYRTIKTRIEAVLAKAASKHTYETRWDMLAKINANLRTLTAETSDDGSSWNPLYYATFAKDTLTYTTEVGYLRAHVRLTPTVDIIGATVKVGKTGSLTAVVSGSVSDAVELEYGANAILVEVTAKDGKTKQTYTINITRQNAPS